MKGDHEWNENKSTPQYAEGRWQFALGAERTADI